MTRARIGFLLLLILLLLGVFVQLEMVRIHRLVAGALNASAEESLKGQWEAARELSARASRDWQRRWRFSAALADHAPMEDIDGLFARLEVAAAEEDALEYASACRELARRIDAMADAHALNWWNLF